MIRLRLDGRSIHIRLQFDHARYDLWYARKPTCVCGLLHCGLNKYIGHRDCG